MSWPKRRDEDLDDEIRAHLAMASRDHMERGASPKDAEQAARREFGNELLVKEATREVWGWSSVERIAQDIRYALRVLRRAPGFAAATIICLGLGIGATTATFSAADAVLLRPLPIHEPSRVLAIETVTTASASARMSYPDLLDVRRNSRSFEDAVGYTLVRLAIARHSEEVPQVKMGMYVTGGFFQTLGVQPILGRPFTTEEAETPGREPVLVLSYHYWRSEFGGKPDVLGSSVRLNGIPFSVVGIASEDFTVNQNIRPAFYIPLTMSHRLSGSRGRDVLERRDARGLNVRARLRPGASKTESALELIALSRNLEAQYPETNRGYTFSVRSELDQRIIESPPLAVVSVLLVVLAVFVLLIACANVASLQLARARSRSCEVAVRLSIGASRGHLFQQLVTESIVLAFFAAALGVALAFAAIRYLAAIRIPTDTPIVIDVQLDERVLFYAALAALASALLSGITPAWKSLRPAIASALKQGDAPAQRTRMFGRNTLVVAQVALSVVLLVASTVLLDAFRKMLVLDPGIRIANLMMIEFDPSLVQYTPDATREFYRQLVERVRSLPGVRSASLARAIPFRPNFTEQAVIPEGYEFPKDQRDITISSNTVDHDYFRTMGVEFLRGRAFTSADTTTSRRVAIVNEEFVTRYWPNSDGIGKRFRYGSEGTIVEVVGVARTGKYLSLAEAPQPYFYLPFEQNLQARMTLVVHTASDPSGMTPAFLQVVRSLDPNQPVYNIRDVQTYFEQGVLSMALTAMKMVWSMGIVGLILAVIGLYGLLAYSVSRRTREIGIRMAIGADRAGVLKLIMRQGFQLAAVGILAGLALSVPLFRGLSAGLAGLGPISPWIFTLVPGVLLLVSLAACWFPALRASRIDPNTALRFE